MLEKLFSQNVYFVIKNFIMIAIFSYINDTFANDRVVYFPVEIEGIEAEGNHLKKYRNKLEELQLPSLLRLASSNVSKTEAYRLMVADAYGSVVIVQAINLHGSYLEVDIFQNSKIGGQWDANKITSNPSNPNAPGKVRFEKLSKMLDRAGFWEMYYFGWGIGLDTQIVVIEGFKNGEYHFFTTSDPIPGPVSKAVDYFRREIGCFK